MPEKNNVGERKNQSIVETTKAMLDEKSMLKFYWAEAVRTAVYIQNQIGEKMLAHRLYFEFTTPSDIWQYCLCACAE